jgi:hypothetical protein
MCDGEVLDGPLSVLIHKPEYPVYAASLWPGGFAIAGGGSEISFVGNPIYLYDFALADEETNPGHRRA